MKDYDIEWELISDEEYEDEPIFIEEKNSLEEEKSNLMNDNNLNILNILKYPTRILKYFIFLILCFFKKLF